MTTFVIVAAISGVLFGAMDALMNANPLARRLYSVYEPLSRTSLNPVAGVVIDLFYGFVMAALFVILYEALPGASGLLKGLSFAVIAWFFRVLMSVLSQWRCSAPASGSYLHALGRSRRDGRAGDSVWPSADASRLVAGLTGPSGRFAR